MSDTTGHSCFYSSLSPSFNFTHYSLFSISNTLLQPSLSALQQISSSLQPKAWFPQGSPGSLLTIQMAGADGDFLNQTLNFEEPSPSLPLLFKILGSPIHYMQGCFYSKQPKYSDITYAYVIAILTIAIVIFNGNDLIMNSGSGQSGTSLHFIFCSFSSITIQQMFL